MREVRNRFGVGLGALGSVAFATLFLNPNHLGTLLGDELGVRMLITAGILQVIGTLIIDLVDASSLPRLAEFMLTLARPAPSADTIWRRTL